ncbi:unnamed protein product [Effrenium voratum]|uniref:Uncharacterized protein n=1 Tax=Effrenium voratum TaxID=2562239 RepID=A0AA36II05_9DINO|nr:unnamed protein product [Effrenium voratum]
MEALDETLKVDPTADALLKRLQDHQAELDELRTALARLRAGAGLTELQRFAEAAAALQASASAGIAPELLSKEILQKANVPVAEVEQARSLLLALTSCEKAQMHSRRRLAEGGAGAAELKDLVGAWERLRRGSGPRRKR